jgi:hypothetical protein
LSFVRLLAISIRKSYLPRKTLRQNSPQSTHPRLEILKATSFPLRIAPAWINTIRASQFQRDRRTLARSLVILPPIFQIGVIGFQSIQIVKALLGDNPLFYFQFFLFYLILGSYYYCNNRSLSFLFCWCAKRNL